MTPSLGLQDAHLWYVDVDSVDEHTITTWSNSLSADERDRSDRFRVVEARRRFLIGRGLLRTLLSCYFGEAPPRAWQFAINAWGRPRLVTPLPQDVRFNLSHTRGLVVCVMAVGREVGIDAEAMDRQAGHLEIAQGQFAPQEIADLQRLPESMRAERFYDYWTLKEAYVKARGLGLSLPLDSFRFLLDGSVRLVCNQSAADNPLRWQFDRVSVTSQHRVATALERRAPDEHVTLKVLPWGTAG